MAQHQSFYGPLDRVFWNTGKSHQTVICCLSSASLQRSVCTGGTNPVSSSLGTVLSSGDKVTVSRCLPWWCSSKGGKGSSGQEDLWCRDAKLTSGTFILVSWAWVQVSTRRWSRMQICLCRQGNDPDLRWFGGGVLQQLSTGHFFAGSWVWSWNRTSVWNEFC